MDQVFVRLASLPMTVKGVTVPDSDGDYTVILNADLCPEVRQNVLRHELSHINKFHFQDTITVIDAETDAC